MESSATGAGGERGVGPAPGGHASEAHYEHVDKGLKANSIGFLDGLAIGLDSTAPAYSLAAVLGSIAVVAGVQAPAVLLVAFLPMFMIAGAFYYMNKADQDCGTCFSWVTRAMGPTLGWLGGWSVFVTGILVIGSLADVTAYYTYDILGLDGLRDSRAAVIGFAAVIIAVMTTICVIGTELSAKVQRVLVFAQVGALLAILLYSWRVARTGTGESQRRIGVVMTLTTLGILLNGATSLVFSSTFLAYLYMGLAGSVVTTGRLSEAPRAGPAEPA